MKNIIIGVLLLTPLITFAICNNCFQQNSHSSLLQPMEKYKLNIQEPSGLCFDQSTNSLWIVSDKTSEIYNTDTRGNLLNSISIKNNDLEGITLIGDSIIVTVIEKSREVLFFNKKGKELKRFVINIEGAGKKGLEGITFNPINKHLFIVNEKNPCLLIETDLNGTVLSKKEISFAKDLSGLVYNSKKNELWIISDESKAIFKCKADGTLIKKFNVDIKQIEGITFDFSIGKLFLVSDAEQKLYIFDMP